MIALCILYRAQISDIFRMATQTADRGYILLVPLVSAYLVFVRRSRMSARGGSGGESLGILIVVVSLASSWVGYDRDILALWHAAPVVAFIGLLVATLGVFRVLSFLPAVVLLFAVVPVPGSVRQLLAIPLQEMASAVTATVLQEIGVSAVRAGNLIEINGVQVAVGEACDGMRLVLPLAIVMYAFVFSLPLRWGIRAFLLVMCLPAALLCNIVRLIPTALAYGYFPDRAALIHDLGGWLMIPLAILLLFGILRLLRWIDFPVSRYRLVTA